MLSLGGARRGFKKPATPLMMLLTIATNPSAQSRGAACYRLNLVLATVCGQPRRYKFATKCIWDSGHQNHSEYSCWPSRSARGRRAAGCLPSFQGSRFPGRREHCHSVVPLTSGVCYPATKCRATKPRSAHDQTASEGLLCLPQVLVLSSMHVSPCSQEANWLRFPVLMSIVCGTCNRRARAGREKWFGLSEVLASGTRKVVKKLVADVPPDVGERN